MIRLGLIGYPLGHSLSPMIHAAALKTSGLDGEYALYPIHPGDRQGLEYLLARARAREISGLNVTIPHKQEVIGFLDELTSTAQAIGAVNVVYMRENRLVGGNTDAPGFLSDLNRFLGHRSQIENQKSAVVLGAGGSARAVVYALLHDGWAVTIASRRIEQAHELSRSFVDYELRISAFVDLQASILLQAPGGAFNLVVNTTPVGMIPNVDQTPLPEILSLSDNVAVYDLIYNPRETKLVQDARSQGLHATTGLGMLIEQAALAFELWTGKSPSRDILWNAVDQG